MIFKVECTFTLKKKLAKSNDFRVNIVPSLADTRICDVTSVTNQSEATEASNNCYVNLTLFMMLKGFILRHPK